MGLPLSPPGGEPAESGPLSLPAHASFPDAGNGAYRILRLFQGAAVRAFDRMTRDPEGAQSERLAAILAGAHGTAFAGDHGLDAGPADPTTHISRLRRIPIRAHAGLLPWLDRVEAGEPDVLARGPVLHLVETSGTTGRAKHLPVNAAWARSCDVAQRLWMLGLLRDDEQLAGGKALSVVSAAVHARSSGGLPIGSNTGRMFLAQPWWTRVRAAVPYAVCEVEDPSVRAYTLLRHALGKDIRSWTTANPSTILLYSRRLVGWWDDLRQDAVDGTLCRGPAAGLDPRSRAALSRGLRRVPIGRLPAQDPRPAALWPLRRVNCWTGGSCRFFLDKLPEALGADLPVREVGIHASEGVFAVSVDDGDPVAWLAGHVLEFRELGDGAAFGPGEVRWAWELETGREYELIVTTEAGLWRYAMGDIVRVTGWLGHAPRLVFVRKAGAFLNATGEKVTEDQVLAAATRCFPAATAVCAATEWCDPPRVVVGVEWPGGPPPGSPQGSPQLGMSCAQLAERFDRHLSSENLEYGSKRSSGRLGSPELVLLPPGTLAQWRAEKVAAGAPEAQVKDPVIVPVERLRNPSSRP